MGETEPEDPLAAVALDPGSVKELLFALFIDELLEL
jgi:hypothetical protein